MDKWQQLTLEVKTLLQQTQEYQDYVALEAAAKATGLFAWEERLKQMQQDMTIALDALDMEKHYAIAAEYKKEKAAFESEPIYQNYITSKQILNDLLQQMLSIFEF